MSGALFEIPPTPVPSLKISGAVNATKSGAGTIYTVPAGKWFNGQVAQSAGSAGAVILVGGVVAANFTSYPNFLQIQAGPGQVISYTGGGTSPVVSVSGVLLENSA